MLSTKMKEGTSTKVADTILLTNAKTIFAKMRQSKDKFKFGDSQIHLYKKAGHRKRKQGVLSPEGTGIRKPRS